MKNKLRILLIAGQFYPDLAGSGIATYNIAKQLAQRGHNVTVCIDENNTYDDSLNEGFRVVRLLKYKDFATGRAGFKEATLCIYDLICGDNFDIVHVFSYMPMLLLSLAGKSFLPPVVFTFWNAPNSGERAIGFYDKPELDLNLASQIIKMQGYDRIIAGSRVSRDMAIELGVNKETLRFAYHGINMQKFYQNLHSGHDILDKYYNQHSFNEGPIVLLPGRITNRKGVFDAIRALAILAKSHRVNMLFTKSNDNKDAEVIKKILRLGKELTVADMVHISNKMVSQTDMPSLYRSSSVVITPSHYEGLGFTAVESLAAGRPTVMTNVCGLNEIGINNYNCLMVPAKDKMSLAQAIRKLIEEKSLSEKISKNGPGSVSRFDISLFVDYCMKEYRELLLCEKR